MRILIIISMFCITNSYAQEKIKGFVGLSQNSDYNFITTESNLNFGIDYDFTDAGGASFFGIYAYGGVIGYSTMTYLYKDFTKYQLDYHLLGGGIKIRFGGRDKLYNPSLRVSFLTEISSKYRGEKLIGSVSENKEVRFSPTDHIYEVKKPLYGGSGGPMIFQNYLSYHYISTPLVASFFFGNEFKVADNLHINLGIGYLFRAFRFYKNEWKLDETEPEVKITQTHSLKETNYGKIETYGYLEFELRINYTFSFNKK